MSVSYLPNFKPISVASVQPAATTLQRVRGSPMTPTHIRWAKFLPPSLRPIMPASPTAPISAAAWKPRGIKFQPGGRRIPDRCQWIPAHPFKQDRKNKGFWLSFLFRMLFSCLVDADFLETERFYANARGEPILRGGHANLIELRDRLRTYMSKKRADARPTALNALRGEILDHSVAKATLQPGLFTLTVPTGGGKTLASLSFALEHAVHNGLCRVIYVIPFTSIIEQTAEVFREGLGTHDDILEHHASFDWDRAEAARSSDDEGTDGLLKLRRAAENWDVPIVVTTAVQFFESLFANRPSRCRKLHNIVDSVVILDEAQTLPVDLLLPCMAALDELARN